MFVQCPCEPDIDGIAHFRDIPIPQVQLQVPWEVERLAQGDLVTRGLNGQNIIGIIVDFIFQAGVERFKPEPSRGLPVRGQFKGLYSTLRVFYRDSQIIIIHRFRCDRQ